MSKAKVEAIFDGRLGRGQVVGDVKGNAVRVIASDTGKIHTVPVKMILGAELQLAPGPFTAKSFIQPGMTITTIPIGGSCHELIVEAKVHDGIYWRGDGLLHFLDFAMIAKASYVRDSWIDVPSRIPKPGDEVCSYNTSHVTPWRLVKIDRLSATAFLESNDGNHKTDAPYNSLFSLGCSLTYSRPAPDFPDDETIWGHVQHMIQVPTRAALRWATRRVIHLWTQSPPIERLAGAHQDAASLSKLFGHRLNVALYQVNYPKQAREDIADRVMPMVERIINVMSVKVNRPDVMASLIRGDYAYPELGAVFSKLMDALMPYTDLETGYAVPHAQVNMKRHQPAVSDKISYVDDQGVTRKDCRIHSIIEGAHGVLWYNVTPDKQPEPVLLRIEQIQV